MNDAIARHRAAGFSLGIRGKLVLGFSIGAATVAGVGGFGVAMLDRNAAMVRTLSDVASPLLTEAGSITEDLFRSEAIVAAALRGQTPTQDAVKAITEIAEPTRTSLERLATLSRHSGKGIDITEMSGSIAAFFEQARASLAASAEQTAKLQLADNKKIEVATQASKIFKKIEELIKRREAAVNEREDSIKTLIQSGGASVDQLGNVLSQTYTEIIPTLQNAYRVRSYLTEIEDDQNTVFGQSDPDKLQSGADRVKRSFDGMRNRIKRLAARAEDADEEAAIDRLAKEVELMKSSVLGESGLFDLHRAAVEASSRARQQEAGLRSTVARLEPLLSGFKTIASRLNEQTRHAVAQATDASRLTISLAVGLAALAAVVFGLLFARSLTRPLHALAAVMRRLAAGDLSAEVPGTARHDEIGTMAQAVVVFKDNAVTLKQATAEQEANTRRNERKLKSEMLALTNAMREQVSGAVTKVRGEIVELCSLSEAMAQIAADVLARSDAAVDATNQANGNVGAVAAASEQLSGSINEISRQVSSASQIAGDAAERTRTTQDTINGLVPNPSRSAMWSS